MFETYLARWDLVPDGAPIRTHSSDLLPVRQAGAPAMLKLAREAEERRGPLLMEWWDGDGAARVLAHDDPAVLLERAMGERSLLAMAHDGRDDAASRILCDAAARLHVPRGKPYPDLIPLTVWFAELWPAAAKHGGVLREAAETAKELLAKPQEIGVLHGDLHHSNVLDFEARGWLAIDPKRLLGERGFDFANIICNPDVKTTRDPARFRRQVQVVARAARLERPRLLRWILAYAGLSAAWILGDGDDASLDLTCAELAAAEIGKD